MWQGQHGEAGASLESKKRVNVREMLKTGKKQRQEEGASALRHQTGLGRGLGQGQARGPWGEPGLTVLLLGAAGGQHLLRCRCH